MTLLHDATQEKKFDVRTIERGLSRGVLSQDEVQKHTKELPDDSESADWVNPEELVESAKS